MSETFNGVDHSEDSNAFDSISDDPQQGSSDVRDLGNLSPVASGKVSSVQSRFSEHVVANKYKTFNLANQEMEKLLSGSTRLVAKESEFFFDSFKMILRF